MATQQAIPGTERKKIKAVESQAIAYRKARDERMALTKAEVLERAKLIEQMKKHEVTVYKFDDDENEEITVSLETNEKVKVRKGSHDDQDAE